MRVMVIIKATPNTEAGKLPDREMLAAMGKFNEELVKAGVMVGGDGLKPSREGKRVRLWGGKHSIVDGPFEDPGQIIAGFWIWEVTSMDEALAWLRRCPDPMPGEDAEVELRPFVEPADFGPEFTPELQAKEDALRARLERGG